VGRTQGTWAEVLNHAKQRLAFLEETHGLRRRQEGRTPVTVLRYRGRELGFEVEFEWREAMVNLLVVRLSDGAPPPAGSYYMHEGRRIRRHLGEVTAGSFPDETRRLREAYGLREPDRYHRMKLQVDVYAEVLRRVADDVLRRGQEVFEAPDPGDRRPGDRRLP
jgi:hypothetical protein